MEAKELKIGNLVFDTENQRADTITGIEKDNEYDRVSLKNAVFPYTPSNRIEPIPLTEEWLLKFGFKKVGDIGGGSDYWNGNLMDLTIEMELSTSNREYDSQSVDGSQKLMYVHQLQNLCFALTKKELELH